ncbi:MAG: HAMP domain-containing protein [Spirochaetaceae bacterium]|nr:MAG: HAMP domain-containing protein [Spirochaetaceae bacterium]
MTLAWKLSVLLATVVLAGSGVTLLAVTHITRHQFLSYVQESDRARARELALLLESYHEERGSFEGVRELLNRDHSRDAMTRRMRGMHGTPSPMMLRMAAPERVFLVDRQGRIIADRGYAENVPEEAPPHHYREQGVPVEGKGTPLAWVLVGSMIDQSFSPQQERFLGALRRAVLLSALLVAAVAMIAGTAFLSGVVRPLRTLTTGARAIAKGDLTVELPSGGGDEIGELADSFRGMRDSLAAANAQRDRMFRDIAHELRTPVTLLRGEIEAMLDGVYEMNAESLRSLQEEIGVLDRLISDVRLVASLEGRRFARDSVEVEALLQRTRTVFSGEARSRGMEIRVRAGEIPALKADRGRLLQVLSNLLINVFQHGAGATRVDLAAELQGEEILLSVSDNGTGVPEEHLPHIFERLYRVNQARTRAAGGSGLGLAIARDLVEAQGGTITAENAPDGGLRVTLSFPIARSADPP